MQPRAHRCRYPGTCGSYVEPPQPRSRRLPVIGKVSGRGPMSARRLWISLGALLCASFAVLLWVGGEIHRVMPPIPATVVSAEGQTIFTRGDIEKGRQVWQSIGGHQL